MMGIQVTLPRQIDRLVEDVLTPSESDLEELGSLAVERVTQRTLRGISATGESFVAYSTKSKYYYNPAGPGSSEQQRKRAIYDFTRRHPKAAAKGRVSQTGTTIVYDSYPAFKMAMLGDATVNLWGAIGATRMLKRMEIWHSAKDQISAGYRFLSDAARRALAHNEGNPARNLPKRRFVGLDVEDRAAIIAKRKEQIEAKLTFL